MLHFKQYAPYKINQEILDSLKLEPNTRGGREPANKTQMSVMDVLEEISSNNFEFICSDSRFMHFDVNIGSNLYSFDTVKCRDAVHILEIILNLSKKTGSFEAALNSTWYYFEKDSIINEPHEFHYFFLCMGDQIIEPMVTISDASFSFPDTFLLEDKDIFTDNDLDNRIALARICYEKWQQGTLPGKIYTMKSKMDQERELEEASGLRGDLTPENSIPYFIKEILLIKRDLKYCVGLLFFIGVILFYIAFFAN